MSAMALVKYIPLSTLKYFPHKYASRFKATS